MSTVGTVPYFFWAKAVGPASRPGNWVFYRRDRTARGKICFTAGSYPEVKWAVMRLVDDYARSSTGVVVWSTTTADEVLAAAEFQAYKAVRRKEAEARKAAAAPTQPVQPTMKPEIPVKKAGVVRLDFVPAFAVAKGRCASLKLVLQTVDGLVTVNIGEWLRGLGRKVSSKLAARLEATMPKEVSVVVSKDADHDHSYLTPGQIDSWLAAAATIDA